MSVGFAWPLGRVQDGPSFLCPYLPSSLVTPLSTHVILHSRQVEKLRVEHMDSFTSGDVDKDGQLSAPEFLAVMIPPPVAINTLTRWAKRRFTRVFTCDLMAVLAGAIVHARNNAPAQGLRL